MPIPPVSQFRVPLLQLLGDGKERTFGEAASALTDHFALTDEERQISLASGYSAVRHHTTWANFHLRKAGLVELAGIKLFTLRPVELADDVVELLTEELKLLPELSIFSECLLQFRHRK